MPKKRHIVKYLLGLTFLVIIFYLAIYMYSAGYLFMQLSCPEKGGMCKSACNSFEIEDGRCLTEMSCCLPMASDTSKLMEAMGARDMELCKTIPDDSASRACELSVLDIIATDFALKYKDRSYCDSIKSITLKDYCLKELATITSTREYCDSIDSGNIRDMCYISFVSTMHDWAICTEKVVFDFNKETCIKKIAIRTKNIALCDQLTIQSELYDCYMNIEFRKNLPIDVNCDDLSHDECDAVEGCQAVMITELKTEAKDVYGGCKRDDRFFCQLTGGRWTFTTKGFLDELGETCLCSQKAYFKGYGCFDCEVFQNSYVKEQCEKLKGAS